MDTIIDQIKYKLMNEFNRSSKIQWKNVILILFVSKSANIYKVIIEWLLSIYKQFYAKLFRKRLTQDDLKAKGTIKMNFTTDTDNNIFNELLKRHVYDFDQLMLQKSSKFYAIKEKTITLTEDIFFKLEFNKPNKTENKKEGEKVTIIEEIPDWDAKDAIGYVYSYTKNVKELVEYLEKEYSPVTIVPEVSKEIEELKLYECIVGRITGYNYHKEEFKGDISEMKISKNMRNIFLEPEIYSKIINHIKKFNDKFWYAKRGIPRTLGMLLHGLPGCGKTSLIKALAQFTKRRILLIDFKIIHTVSQLNNIVKGKFRDTITDQIYKFEPHNTIYVFEDFDCMSDIFMERDNITTTVSSNHNEHMLKRILASEIKKRSKKSKGKGKDKGDDSDSEIEINIVDDEDYASMFNNKEKLTLSSLLEFFDGVIERDGMFNILTTNKRNEMDSALIRPGRIDLDIEIPLPSIHLIGYIFNFMYSDTDSDILKKLFLDNVHLIPQNKFSTAKIMNSFILHEPSSGIKDLISNNDNYITIDEISQEEVWKNIVNINDTYKLYSPLQIDEQNISLNEYIESIYDNGYSMISLKNNKNTITIVHSSENNAILKIKFNKPVKITHYITRMKINNHTSYNRMTVWKINNEIHKLNNIKNEENTMYFTKTTQTLSEINITPLESINILSNIRHIGSRYILNSIEFFGCLA